MRITNVIQYNPSILNRRKSSSTTSSDGSPRATPTTRIKKIRKSSNSSSRNSVRSVATVDSREPVNSEMKNENNIENMHSILVKSLISNLQLDNKNNDHNHERENEHENDHEKKDEGNDRNDTSDNGSTNYFGDSDDNEASNFHRERTESDTVLSISPPFSPHSVASTVVSTTQDQYVQKIPSTASTPCRPGILEESMDCEIPSSSVEKSRTVIKSNNDNVETKNEDNEDKSVKELKLKLNELNIHADNVCSVTNDALALQSVMAALDSALNSPAKPEEKEINNETVGVTKHNNENNDVQRTVNENENQITHDEVLKGIKKVDSEDNMITNTATLNGYSTTHTAPVDDYTHRTSAIDRDYVKVEKEVVENSNMSDISNSRRPGNVSGGQLDEDEEKVQEVEDEDEEEEDDQDEEYDEEEDGDDENGEDEEEEEEEEEEDAVDPGPQVPSTIESTYEGSDVSEENADIEDIEVGPTSRIKGLRSRIKGPRS